jgi:hypothetical protein
MLRVQRYFLSNSNIAGCGFALVVVAAYLAGVIKADWYALATVGYALGYLLMYKAEPEQIPENLSSTEALDWLNAHALPKLTGEAQAHLRSILGTTAELMPRLKEMESQGLVQVENRTKLKQVLNRYLPDILRGYFKLPSLYASSAKVAEGKTPYKVLVEQLSLLDKHVQEIRDGLYSENVNALLANARFLSDKFKQGIRLDN